jgi:predicted HicB family RNase H-like nuclease
MAREKQSKLGRPPKHEGERLSKNRTFRVRGTLDEQLEAAAQKAGRSVSEEIERRLDDSFKRIEELYGGPHLSATFRILADNLALVKAQFGERWAESDLARDEIARAFVEFVEVIAREVPGFYSVAIETGERGLTRVVRLPEYVRRRLEQAAKHHGWSMNTEIVDRLDVSFQRENEEEMKRTAAQEGVAAVQRFDEELSHRSADKEKKSK